MQVYIDVSSLWFIVFKYLTCYLFKFLNEINVLFLIMSIDHVYDVIYYVSNASSYSSDYRAPTWLWFHSTISLFFLTITYVYVSL